MSDTPSSYVVALVTERAGYMRASKPEKALAVDAELERLGWAVDANGSLVKYAPKAASKSAAKPAEKRPESAPREKR